MEYSETSKASPSLRQLIPIYGFAKALDANQENLPSVLDRQHDRPIRTNLYVAYQSFATTAAITAAGVGALTGLAKLIN